MILIEQTFPQQKKKVLIPEEELKQKQIIGNDRIGL
jgi:hypothetical protein